MNNISFEEYKLIKESIINCEEVDPSLKEKEKMVREWLEETDQLNEGIFGAIWSWIKRNWSPRARKIHKLAEEYENELEAETRAEYEKADGKKDLASKLRTSYGGRISQDIERKMELEAGDDADYRELVSTLITLKNYDVRRKLLDEYQNRLEPTDAQEIDGELTKKARTAKEEYDGVMSSLMGDEKDSLKEAAEAASKEFSKQMFLKSNLSATDKHKSELSASIALYLMNASKKFPKERQLEVNAENAQRLVKEIAKLMEELVSSGDKEETAQLAKIALGAVDKYLRSEPERNFDKSKIKKLYDEKVIKPEDVKDKLEDTEVKVGDGKAEVIKDEDKKDPEVDKVIDDASKEVKSDGKEVTVKNVVIELLNSVKDIDNLGSEIRGYADLDQKGKEQLRNDLVKLFGLAKVAAAEVIDPSLSVITGGRSILKYRKDNNTTGELSPEDLEKISQEF